MKKNYIRPNIVINELEIESLMLTTSGDAPGGSTALGKDHFLDDFDSNGGFTGTKSLWDEE